MFKEHCEMVEKFTKTKQNFYENEIVLRQKVDDFNENEIAKNKTLSINFILSGKKVF